MMKSYETHMMWVIISTMQNVPQVWLIPKNTKSEAEGVHVAQTAPAVLGELF